MNGLRQAWARYQAVLHRHPCKVHCLQTAVLMGTGDVIAQTYVEGKAIRDVEAVRVLRFAAIGVCVGPALHTWYSRLDRLVGSSGAAVAVKKVALDQTLVAPLLMCFILSSVTLLGGADLAAVRAKLHQDYVTVMITNYKVWPLVQLCNFALVPLQYRVLVVQCVALVWNTYLSRQANLPVSS